MSYTRDEASVADEVTRCVTYAAQRLLFGARLGSDELAFPESIDLRLRAIHQPSHRRRMGRHLGERHRQSRAQDPLVDAAETHRGATPVLRDAVAERARQAPDHASQWG